ncbi:MAG: DUF3656 domain-containing protein [Methanosarcinaceae archaeon]|nr:DUF3656 domain-containing protein [Methanosarcinaceae archaeon]MDD4497961.1 DUF3656 domain-containing protein [Methanosarcinaceae archaeon]
MNKNLTKCNSPEILAPAGDYDAFLGALKGGADAVYLGVGEFNARQGAKNFNALELKKAIELAHSRGVRVYLAFNIPLKEEELQPALDVLDQAYTAGIDAIILRDPGLFRLLKEAFPDLPLHASTQMTIHNKAGVRFVEGLGASRVIVSRELLTNELKEIVAAANIGVEIFIHGALCYSYSGKCLFSSFVSGRSGNRGACAQPCRWRYRLMVDGQPQNKVIGGDYPISCAELFTLPGLDKIVATGVESLKIEGRMKKPEYVTGTSAIYKKAAEWVSRTGNPLSREELEQKETELAKLFCRGFTGGFVLGDREVTHLEYSTNYGVYLGKVVNVISTYPHARITLTLMEDLQVDDGIGIHTQIETKTGMLGSTVNGIISRNGTHLERAYKGDKVTLEISPKTGKVVSLQDEVFLTTDKRFLAGLQDIELKPLLVNIKVSARKGERLKITVESPLAGLVEFEDEYIVQPAQKAPTTGEKIRNAMEQLGDTPYEAGSIEIRADEDIFIPVGVLKGARRQAMDLLLVKAMNLIKREPENPRLSDLTGLCKNDADAAISPATPEGPAFTKIRQGPRLSVEVKSPEGLLQATDGKADIVYLPVKRFYDLTSPRYQNKLASLLEKGLEIVFNIPQVAHDRELKALTPLLKEVKEAGFTVACADFGAVQLAKELEIPFVARKDLVVFNSFTVDTFKKAGAYRVGLSSELNLKEIRAIYEALEACGNTEELEITAHGREQMLVTEHDLLRPLIDRNIMKMESEACLVDHKDQSFPIKRWGTRTIIYNSAVLSMLDYVEDLKVSGVDVLRLDLTLNDEKDIKDIVRAYRQALEGKKGKLKKMDVEYNTGHYFNGI